MNSTTFSQIHMLNKAIAPSPYGMVLEKEEAEEQLDLDELTRLKLLRWLLTHKRDEISFSLSLLPSLLSSFPFSHENVVRRQLTTSQNESSPELGHKFL